MPGEPPPDPFRASDWSTKASNLDLSGWTQTDTIGGVAHGRLVDSNGGAIYLFPEAAGSAPSDGVAWTIASELPSWALEHLMTSGSATVIRAGTDATDGTKRTVYASNPYKLTQQWISGTATMKAVVS